MATGIEKGSTIGTEKGDAVGQPLRPAVPDRGVHLAVLPRVQVLDVVG
jgi:hypothetical protein